MDDFKDIWGVISHSSQKNGPCCGSLSTVHHSTVSTGKNKRKKRTVQVFMLHTDNYSILDARIYNHAFIFLSGAHLGNYIRK